MICTVQSVYHVIIPWHMKGRYNICIRGSYSSTSNRPHTEITGALRTPSDIFQNGAWNLYIYMYPSKDDTSLHTKERGKSEQVQVCQPVTYHMRTGVTNQIVWIKNPSAVVAAGPYKAAWRARQSKLEKEGRQEGRKEGKNERRKGRELQHGSVWRRERRDRRRTS